MTRSDVSGGAGLAAEFDPFTSPYLDDPYAFFARARSATPLFYSPALDYWVVTRYRDIKSILQAPERYSNVNAVVPIRPVCAAAGRLLSAAGVRPVPTLVNNDPPAHSRVRRLSNTAFTPRRVAAMESFVRELTVRFVTERLANGHADLVRDLAWELPALVIFRILGVPEDDVARIKAGAKSRLLFTWGRPTDAEQMELAHGMGAFWQYAEGLVEHRAREPRDDFTSDLLVARDGDTPALSQLEVTTIVNGLLLAGHETTTGLLGNACRRLLAERDAWHALCRHPALIPNAVEEVLRFESSVIGWRRRTTQPVQIAGMDVPAGANLLLLLGSGNRDAAVFENPDQFDIRRHNAKEHLSFGHGVHFCLGASLARLQTRVVLEELSARLPTLRLMAGQTFSYLPNTSFRGPLSVLVEWSR